MKFDPSLERYRERQGPYASNPGDDYGMFQLPGFGQTLRVLASPGDAHEDIPWEHVSVSLKNRCPNWREMCYVKDLFWDAEECVMQLHPPRSKWINNHPYCLHLWKPIAVDIPMPPEITVGIPRMEVKPHSYRPDEGDEEGEVENEFLR